MSPSIMNSENGVGEPIPALTDHAVSVSLPTWKACVGYEEGEAWVINRMKTGYPRFFIHLSIQKLATDLAKRFCKQGETAMLFPSCATANQCLTFITNTVNNLPPGAVHVIEIAHKENPIASEVENLVSPNIWACIYPSDQASVAKQFWQHTGSGISSRRAEYVQSYLDAGSLECKSKANCTSENTFRGPRRYRSRSTAEQSPKPSNDQNLEELDDYVEKRFGRNLDVTLALKAKSAIKKRIAGSLSSDSAPIHTTERGFSEDDVYLYASGMTAIYSTHKNLLLSIGSHKSICFGFPYIDTLKILEKFGPGCQFYGHGSEAELDQLEERLKAGEKFLALFCEFPGNPLLVAPNLARIRKLADQYEFLVVVDETVGNFLNVDVLPYSDVVVSSLTKIFSGDSNVMGGSAILNPKSRYYAVLKSGWDREYEDNYWAEDAIFMERNSRDFVSRVDRINRSTEALCDMLVSHPKVKRVYYPKYNETRNLYDSCRTENGGYGGLFSVTFHSTADSMKFYDAIDVAKGPSLGTNFTLSSPYVILAHYNELPWATSFDVPIDLVRFSVGLEEAKELIDRFNSALNAIEGS